MLIENPKTYKGTEVENIFFRPSFCGKCADELGIRVIYNMPMPTTVQVWSRPENVLQPFESGWSGGVNSRKMQKTIDMQKVKAETRFSAEDYFSTVYELITGRTDVNLDDLSGTELEEAETSLFRASIAESIRATMWYGDTNREALGTFDGFLKRICEDVKEEFRLTEPDMRLTLSDMPMVEEVVDMAAQCNLLAALVGVPNGVIAMSAAIPTLVETSTNLASVKFSGKQKVVVTTSQRSSVESAKEYAKMAVESVFLLAGAEVEHSDGYPGWAPNTDSHLLKVTVDSYKNLFGAEPKVKAVHAGLECGLFLEKYPHLEMVSFGPTLRGVHSPDERLEISTVDKFWRLVKEVVKSI